MTFILHFVIILKSSILKNILKKLLKMLSNSLFFLIMLVSSSLSLSFAFSVINDECIETDLQAYRHSFLLSSDPSFFPIYSNYVFDPTLSFLTAPLENVTILIHGLSRDADRYFCQGMNASENQIIIVPYFPNRSLSLSEWNGKSDPDISTSPYWTESDWSEGGLDVQYGLSSFEILDELIEFLKGKNVKGKIVVAGFSAGGQFVQRYAWASDEGNDGSVRFFVSDPSSFLYFTKERPGEDCRELKSVAIEDCQSFETPNLNFETSLGLDASDCKKFNDYKYGLDKIDENNEYLLDAYKKATLITYSKKEILYVFGGDDVCNCVTKNYVNDPKVCYPLSPDQCLDTYPNGVNNAMETECRAMLEGSNRLQRGLNYMAYLKFLCGKNFVVNYAVVSGMGHDSSKYFGSDFFKKYGFSRGEIISGICTLALD